MPLVPRKMVFFVKSSLITPTASTDKVQSTDILFELIAIVTFLGDESICALFEL